MNKFLKNKKIIICLSFFLILVLGIVCLKKMLREAMNDGGDYSGLNRSITLEIFDSCSIAFDRYHKVYGHFPKYEGKYFYDSIKCFTNVSDAYLYADAVVRDSFPLYKAGIKRDSLLKMKNLFIGIGTAKQYIVYKYLSNNYYILYSVGENDIDENGIGDDIVFKRYP